MENPIKLSVVIPAYNETKNLASGVLNEVEGYLKKQDFSYEVLIIDDGSTDNTVGIMEEQIKSKKGFKLIKNPHGGKALTVISGILATKGGVAIFTDMDQATPINQVEKFFPKFEEGFDVVIGSRSGRQGAPLIRKINALGFGILRNLILGLPFSDTQCGFKGFNRKAIELVFPKMQQIWESHKAKRAAVNAAFDVEMLFLAKKLNLKITEVGVEWRHVGTERLQLVSDAVEATQNMIRIKINDLSGGYT